MSSLILIAGPNSPYMLMTGPADTGYPIGYNEVLATNFNHSYDFIVSYNPGISNDCLPVVSNELINIRRRSVRNAGFRTATSTNSTFKISEYVVHINEYTPPVVSNIQYDAFETHVNSYTPPTDADITDTSYQSNFNSYTGPVDSFIDQEIPGDVKTGDPVRAVSANDINADVFDVPTQLAELSYDITNAILKELTPVSAISQTHKVIVKNGNASLSSKKNTISATKELISIVTPIPHAPNTYSVNADSTFGVIGSSNVYARYPYTSDDKAKVEPVKPYKLIVFPGGIGHGNKNNR